MNKPYNIQNKNICNGIFHISFFKALLINEGETTRGEREYGRNGIGAKRLTGRNDPDSSCTKLICKYWISLAEYMSKRHHYQNAPTFYQKPPLFFSKRPQFFYCKKRYVLYFVFYSNDVIQDLSSKFIYCIYMFILHQTTTNIYAPVIVFISI